MKLIIRLKYLTAVSSSAAAVSAGSDITAKQIGKGDAV
jgi:hypothetical protein